MSTTISEQTVYQLLISALDNKTIDKTLFVRAVMSSTQGSSRMEYLLHLLYNKDTVLPKRGDYFSVTPISHHVDSKFNYDTLKDLGLLSDDYEIYGKILDDEGWATDYDPFYGRVKVELYYNDSDGKMEKFNHTLNTASLNIINKLEIKYFKSLEDGKNIKRTTKNRNKQLEDSKETVT